MKTLADDLAENLDYFALGHLDEFSLFVNVMSVCMDFKERKEAELLVALDDMIGKEEG